VIFSRARDRRNEIIYPWILANRADEKLVLEGSSVFAE
jgi:hypothetical protein